MQALADCMDFGSILICLIALDNSKLGSSVSSKVLKDLFTY